MRLFVLPVSGGAFPTQIALMAELTSLGVRPDLVMGSSGGNVAGYIGLAADWNPYAMERISALLNSGLFARSWWPWPLNGIPSVLMGYFLGTVYRAGEGTLELFRSIFTPQTIGATEIWTGTLNRTTRRPQFFCNRKRGESCFDPKAFDPRLLNCMPLTFLDQDIARISKVCLASASIPILVPEQIIDGDYHTDGGTAFASPLTALQSQVMTACHNQSLHIDYLSSYDLESHPEEIHDIGSEQHEAERPYRNLYEHGSLTANEMVRSLCLLDRLTALEMLRQRPTTDQPDTTLDDLIASLSLTSLSTVSETSGVSNVNRNRNQQDTVRQPFEAIRCLELNDLTRAQLSEIERFRSCFRRSMLELFPITTKKVDLVSFDKDDISTIISQTRRRYRCRLWVIDRIAEERSDRITEERSIPNESEEKSDQVSPVTQSVSKDGKVEQQSNPEVVTGGRKPKTKCPWYLT